MLWEVFHKQRVFPLSTWLTVISSNGRWWSRLMVTVSPSPFRCLKYWSHGNGRRKPKLVLLATEGQQRRQHEPKPWVRSWKAVCPGWVFAITEGRCVGYRREWDYKNLTHLGVQMPPTVAIINECCLYYCLLMGYWLREEELGLWALRVGG